MGDVTKLRGWMTLSYNPYDNKHRYVDFYDIDNFKKVLDTIAWKYDYKIRCFGMDDVKEFGDWYFKTMPLQPIFWKTAVVNHKTITRPAEDWIDEKNYHFPVLNEVTVAFDLTMCSQREDALRLCKNYLRDLKKFGFSLSDFAVTLFDGETWFISEMDGITKLNTRKKYTI